MPLFERSTAPIGQRPKRYGEPIYAYYRDSERPGIIAIRNLYEEWFQEIPEDEQQDLQQRFRSSIERQHRSAVFELFLHHFLVGCGFQLEFHPDVPGVTTHDTNYDTKVQRHIEPYARSPDGPVSTARVISTLVRRY